ncbi:MAG: hypothetical protein RL543_455, partial [Pseudomonadota bacterium]
MRKLSGRGYFFFPAKGLNPPRPGRTEPKPGSFGGILLEICWNEGLEISGAFPGKFPRLGMVLFRVELGVSNSGGEPGIPGIFPPNPNMLAKPAIGPRLPPLPMDFIMSAI